MTHRQISKGDKSRIAKLAAMTQAMREGQAKYFSITSRNLMWVNTDRIKNQRKIREICALRNN